MSNSISLRPNEIMIMMISTLKNRFLQKLKKLNAEAKFSLREEEWMHNLFIGNLKTKSFSLSMGESYEFQMIICACPDGTVIMELIFEKKFEQEMKNQGMDPKLIKKVGSCNCKEEIYCQSTQPFYLEDLVIINVDTGETVKQMFGRDGNVSWELTGLSWELNITGIVTPSSKSMVTPAATSPSITGGTSAATVVNVTNPVSVTYTVPPPNLTVLGATATSPTVQQIVRTSGRQPPILGMIQQSLQNKAPNAQSVQYLTTARSFNIPPPQIPRFPAESSMRGKAPTIPRMPTTSSSRSPAASTPKKNKSKKGRKLLKKIIPLPQETTDDDQETTNDEDPRLHTHEYETLGEESSISEIQGERESPRLWETTSTVRLDNTEYVPVAKVAELVEEAVNKLLAEGIIVRAQESSSESPESPEKTIVQVDNEQTEEIQDISKSIFQNQSTKESGEKENDESVTEKGENSNSGPETRSKSKSKGPEEQH